MSRSALAPRLDDAAPPAPTADAASPATPTGYVIARPWRLWAAAPVSALPMLPAALFVFGVEPLGFGVWAAVAVVWTLAMGLNGRARIAAAAARGRPAAWRAWTGLTVRTTLLNALIALAVAGSFALSPAARVEGEAFSLQALMTIWPQALALLAIPVPFAMAILVIGATWRNLDPLPAPADEPPPPA